MRLQAVRVPDPRHAGMADSLRFPHRLRAPVGRIFRLRVQGGFYDRSDFLGRQTLETQGPLATPNEGQWRTRRHAR